MAFKVNTLHDTHLRPVGVVMCDVCVKAFCGFIVVAYFTALGTVGNFDPPTGQ